MSFQMLYYMQVKAGRDLEFRDAWAALAAEIKTKYQSTGSAVFKASGGVYLVLAQWKSFEDWESFWVTKEMGVETLTRIKSCLVGPSQPVPLRTVYSSLPFLSTDSGVGVENSAKFKEAKGIEVKGELAEMSDSDFTEMIKAMGIVDPNSRNKISK